MQTRTHIHTRFMAFAAPNLCMACRGFRVLPRALWFAPPGCAQDLVLLEAPAAAGSDYTIKYHLAAELLAAVAAQIKVRRLAAPAAHGSGLATPRAPLAPPCTTSGVGRVCCRR